MVFIHHFIFKKPAIKKDLVRPRVKSFTLFASTFAVFFALGFGQTVQAQPKPKPKLASPAEFPEARRVNFDLEAGHKFLGLGSVIWPGAPFASQRHEVMDCTHMSWMRIPLTNFFHEGDARPGISVPELLAQRKNHALRAAAEHLSSRELRAISEADERTAQRYHDLGDELQATNIHFIIAALPGFPKSWTQSFSFKGTEYKTFMGGQPGQPDHRQDYVTLAVAEMIAARQAGLNISAVEMPGEPDEPSSGVRPDVANSMVGKLRKTLDQNGLIGVEIASPGTGSTLTAARWIAAMEAKDGHLSAVKYFSVHDYDSASLPAPVGLAPSFLRSTHSSKPILVTEFNNSSPRWSKPPYTGTPRHSPPEEGLKSASAVNHDEYAVSVVAEALKLISDGANGVCIWEMNDIYWKKTSYGLIDIRGGARPTVKAFASWMKQVGRSSNIRAFGTNAGPGLGAAAFRIDNGQKHDLVVVLANMTSQAIRVRVTYQWKNEQDDAVARTLNIASIFPLKAGETVSGKRGGPTVEVPANSVVTLSNADVLN